MTTLASKATEHVEAIRMAMRGKVWGGEDEEGRAVWIEATPEECEREAVSIVESWYYRANDLAAAGRTYEEMCRRHRWRVSLPEWCEVYEAERRRYDAFAYSYEVEEMLDEAEGVE